MEQVLTCAHRLAYFKAFLGCLLHLIKCKQYVSSLYMYSTGAIKSLSCLRMAESANAEPMRWGPATCVQAGPGLTTVWTVHIVISSIIKVVKLRLTSPSHGANESEPAFKHKPRWFKLQLLNSYIPISLLEKKERWVLFPEPLPLTLKNSCKVELWGTGELLLDLLPAYGGLFSHPELSWPLTVQ